MSRAFPAGGYAPPIQFRRYSPGSIPGSTKCWPGGATPGTPRWPKGPATPSRALWPWWLRSKTVVTGLGRPSPGPGSGAEPAVPGGVGAQRPEEIHPAEGRPVGVAEVELRVDALPQQEPAEPLFPRSSDHQVGVGLPGRVQVV